MEARCRGGCMEILACRGDTDTMGMMDMQVHTMGLTNAHMSCRMHGDGLEIL